MENSSYLQADGCTAEPITIVDLILNTMRFKSYGVAHSTWSEYSEASSLTSAAQSTILLLGVQIDWVPLLDEVCHVAMIQLP